MEQMSRDLVRRCALLALPKEFIEVIGFAEKSALADIECLQNSL